MLEQPHVLLHRVDYALDAVVSLVHADSEVTGGDQFLPSLTAEEHRRFQKLPLCANDDDCAFLLRHLCDGPPPAGPYPQVKPIVRVTEELSTDFVFDNIRAYQ